MEDYYEIVNDRSEELLMKRGTAAEMEDWWEKNRDEYKFIRQLYLDEVTVQFVSEKE